MLNLFKTDSFTHKGKRENNEDSLFPNNDIPTTLNNLYLVCDGVGGLDKGEIASDLCCTQLNMYFSTNEIKVSDKNTIDDAISFVEKKFDSYMKDNPESVNMGSTITLLHLHTQGATVAHMGDSRVYHIRDGKIIFRTKDHSLVQSLVDEGLISEEEMQSHPRSNQINRAMRGASVKQYPADTIVRTDLQPNDIFFLCTDGVLESFTDKELEELFTATKDLETLAAKMVRKCTENSNDNYTGYLVQLTNEYINTLQHTKKQEIKKEEPIADNFKEPEVVQKQEEVLLETEAKTVLSQTENKEQPAIVEEDKYTEIPELQDKQLSKTEVDKEVEKVVSENVHEEVKKEQDTLIENQFTEEQSKPTNQTNFEKAKAENNNLKLILVGLIGAILAYMIYSFLGNKEEKPEEPKTTKTEIQQKTSKQQ